jgi:2-oxoglutarate dehydrogenase E2 component (dihydrolipoamide succinyltransferase)
MKIEIKVPSPGESITQVQLAAWLAEEGDYVDKDQEIAEIDSDKATLSISASESGSLHRLVEEGDTIAVDAIIAHIDTEARPKKTRQQAAPKEEKEEIQETPVDLSSKDADAGQKQEAKSGQAEAAQDMEEGPHFSPLARKLMKEKELNSSEFIEWLRRQRVGREDVEAFAASGTGAAKTSSAISPQWGGGRAIERKKLTTLRIKLAERLVAVKNDTAMLTTFNEVDMSGIMVLRKKYKERFIETHGLGIGFMSFFTKAVTIALHDFPQVNAMIEGEELILHDYADIGIAVSTPKGLMVPVIRNAEVMSLAGIEEAIRKMAEKARNNKITLDDMKGGTFTITNGGVFGSMLSTPILNPPQSAILGMHNIQDRPVAVNGKVEIRPMMYVALSYDHRVIDGKESVSFLVRVKELLEHPVKMLLGGQDPEEMLLDI